jgi:2-dehydro-3-deoxyphosphogluconate aldolase/(4S)-4-hydroxy-2-oxoglutarate aldolase
MNRSEVADRIVAGGVIPIVRTPTADDARAVIAAIVEGGITAIEITMTVPGAVELIDDLSRNTHILVGAGTVLNVEMARECIGAGARFIISPATDFEIIDYCNQVDVLVMPGAMTPTEIINAWDAGADFVKVFPITAIGGAKYLKLIKGPLPHVKIIPTGGVDQSTAGDLIKAGAEAVGVGSDLVDIAAVREGRASDISSAAHKYLDIVEEARKTITRH